MPIPDRAKDARQLLVDGLAVVVKRRRLKNNGSRSHQDGQSKYPEEETIQHHSYVFPILANLLFVLFFRSSVIFGRAKVDGRVGYFTQPRHQETGQPDSQRDKAEESIINNGKNMCLTLLREKNEGRRKITPVKRSSRLLPEPKPINIFNQASRKCTRCN